MSSDIYSGPNNHSATFILKYFLDKDKMYCAFRVYAKSRHHCYYYTNWRTLLSILYHVFYDNWNVHHCPTGTEAYGEDLRLFVLRSILQ